MIGLGTLERLLVALNELRASLEKASINANGDGGYLMALEDVETRIRAEFGAESELRAAPFRELVQVGEHTFGLPFPRRVRAIALWMHDTGGPFDAGLRVSFTGRDAHGHVFPCNLPASWLNPQRDGSAQFAHLAERVIEAGDSFEVTLANDSAVPVYVQGALMYRAIGGSD